MEEYYKHCNKPINSSLSSYYSYVNTHALTSTKVNQMVTLNTVSTTAASFSHFSAERLKKERFLSRIVFKLAMDYVSSLMLVKLKGAILSVSFWNLPSLRLLHTDRLELVKYIL